MDRLVSQGPAVHQEIKSSIGDKFAFTTHLKSGGFPTKTYNKSLLYYPARTGIKMRCPHCQGERSRVIDTTRDSRGGIRRRRECRTCTQRYSTYERPILATPLIIKQDKTREEFDREKLIQGIRISCAKRPVPAADIERLVGEIESRLRSLGQSEVSSRVVGDLVIAGLKDMDQIAYIRYAIVYLGLDDLRSIQAEINQLLEN